MAISRQHNNDFSHYPATPNGAMHLGSIYYYTGKPCKKGHIGLRYASSGNCVQCIEEQRGVIFDKHKDRFSPENLKRSNEAMQAGKMTYTPTEPCPKGHLERYTLNNNCVQCNNQSQKNRKEKLKWARIKKLYGMSMDDFNAMMIAQNNQCAICCVGLNQKNTHIDHCHATGKVRSLLCSRCNQAIGLIDESIERVEKIKTYLKEHIDAS